MGRPSPPLPSPTPPCFCSRPISRAAKTTKIVFLAKNATVTLASQAILARTFQRVKLSRGTQAVKNYIKHYYFSRVQNPPVFCAHMEE